jgi:hypothetical protein
MQTSYFVSLTSAENPNAGFFSLSDFDIAKVETALKKAQQHLLALFNATPKTHPHYSVVRRAAAHGLVPSCPLAAFNDTIARIKKIEAALA